MQKLLLLVGLLLVSLLLPDCARAQDPNYSLQYANPVTINPAFAGLMEGDWRINAGHRWRRATASENLQTSVFGADYRIDNRYLEGGANLFLANDQVPGISTTWALLSLAYEAPFGDRVRYDHLRAGFQAGIVARSLGTANLTFEDQFDGIGFVGVSEDENVLANMNQIVPDVSAGLMWYRTQKIVGNVEMLPFVGFSMSHINRPELGFSDSELERQNLRYDLNVGGRLLTRSAFEFHGNVLLTSQNESTQGTFNLFTRIVFFENGILFGRHKASLMVGGSWRPGDAGVAYVGFEYEKRITLGAAFDFYTGNEAYINNAFGGLHVNFCYLIGQRRYRGSSLPFPFF